MPDPFKIDGSNKDALRGIHWDAKMPSPLIYGSDGYNVMRSDPFFKQGDIQSDA